MSMVENIREIREQGMEKFLEKQEKKYRCSECGDIVSVHDGKCYTCLQHEQAFILKASEDTKNECFALISTFY